MLINSIQWRRLWKASTRSLEESWHGWSGSSAQFTLTGLVATLQNSLLTTYLSRTKHPELKRVAGWQQSSLARTATSHKCRYSSVPAGCTVHTPLCTTSLIKLYCCWHFQTIFISPGSFKMSTYSTRPLYIPHVRKKAPFKWMRPQTPLKLECLVPLGSFKAL